MATTTPIVATTTTGTAILIFSLVSIVSVASNWGRQRKKGTKLSTRKSIVELADDIRQIYLKHAQKQNIPGISYAIVSKGEIVVSGTFGQREIENEAPVTLDTRFRIASMSKSFTAMAILKMQEEQLLSLDDLVEIYIPEIKSVSLLTNDSVPLNIRSLMSMEGGYPQDDPWADRFLHIPNEDLSQIIASGLILSTPPCTRFEYSNLGYAILGLIITRVTNMPYQQYIRSKILAPLGMKDTQFEYDEVPRDALAIGYRWEEKRWKIEPMLHDGSFGAMGGLITTIGDFAKYVALHLSVWPPADVAEESVHKGPICRAALRDMHTPKSFVDVQNSLPNPLFNTTPIETATMAMSVSYTYGLMAWTSSNGIRMCGHAGGLPGFGSEYKFLPDHDVGVISFGNRTYCGMSGPNMEVIRLLLSHGAVTKRAIPLHPMLSLRKAQLVELLTSWNEVLGDQILSSNFFLDKPRALWMQETAKAINDIGGVVVVGDITPMNNLRGTFIIHGSRNPVTQSGGGSGGEGEGRAQIKVFFTMTPENPPLIQHVTLTVPQERK